MNRRPALALGAAALALGAGAFVLAGCPSSTTTTLYTPITGFFIDSEALTAGVGCGPNDGQVYAYAAVVTGALVQQADGGYAPGPAVSGLPVSAIFPCYANGEISNLSTPDGGTTDYQIAIYGFSKSALPAAADCANTGGDAGCPGDSPTFVKSLEPSAGWTASCVGTQIPGTSQNAVCTALVPLGDGGSPEAGADASADGGDAASDGGGEAGDAGPEASGSDGGDAATSTDAGDGAASDGPAGSDAADGAASSDGGDGGD